MRNMAFCDRYVAALRADGVDLKNFANAPRPVVGTVVESEDWMRSSPSLGTLGLYGAVTISSVGLVGFCLLHLSNHPSVGFFGDSWAYAKYAARFRDFGFLHDFGSIRTYGYPAFIYLVSFIPGALQNISLAVGMTQYALLASGALALSAQVWPTSHKIAIAIYAGLMLNLFVLSIVLDVLTDALSVPVMVWLLVVIQAAMRARTSVAVFALILVGSLIASMSVMIRPANISILNGWAVAVPIALWHRYRFAALKRFPADLNRRDSQRVKDERVFVH
jgi:hypothetical protein